jgi:multimeric flavodoxin WrbA
MGQFRKSYHFSGIPAGVLAVGACRNGGQELTLQTVQAVLLCHEMLVVGEGRPTGHFGGTLWNNAKDDISQDEFGMQTAQNLGRRIAQLATERR